MYSAALLLMLAVRIYADSMEGPTGKNKTKNKNKKKRKEGEMFARTSPLQDGVAVYKVDAWGFKAALFLPVAGVHVQTEVVFGCFFFFFSFLIFF